MHVDQQVGGQRSCTSIAASPLAERVSNPTFRSSLASFRLSIDDQDLGAVPEIRSHREAASLLEQGLRRDLGRSKVKVKVLPTPGVARGRQIALHHLGQAVTDRKPEVDPRLARSRACSTFRSNDRAPRHSARVRHRDSHPARALRRRAEARTCTPPSRRFRGVAEQVDHHLERSARW